MGDRVSAQVGRRVAFHELRGFLHAFEKGRHGARVEAGLFQGGKAETVGFPFVLPREIELVLNRSCLCANDTGGRGVRIAAGGKNGHCKCSQRGQRIVALAIDHARVVMLGDVRDFVAQHGGKLGFILGKQDQPGIDTDETAGQRKGVDRIIIDGKKLKRISRLGTVRHEAPAETVEVVGYFRIIKVFIAGPDLEHALFADLTLDLRRNDLLRNVTQVRQAISVGDQRQRQKCGKKGSFHGGYDNTEPFEFHCGLQFLVKCALSGQGAVGHAKCAFLRGFLHMDKVGKYEIVKELGRGATSTVYLALDTFSQQQVALKVFNLNVLRDSTRAKAYRKLLLTEASLAGKLSHPHIVKVFDAVMDGDVNYMVMEYVEGETLEKYGEVDHLMDLGHIAEIIYKCCKALEYAQYQGVTHRDIKPANILISGESDIKISDFGAAVIDNQQSTQVSGVGSPAYMSPEQIRELPLTHQTDIYSLGVTMYRLLTGKLPFEAANSYSMIYQIMNIDPLPPSAYRPEIPPELDAMVLRAMSKETEHRYQTWDEFARDLVTFITHNVPQQAEIFDTEKFDTLRDLNFFKHFSDVELWEVLRISAWRKVNADETIIREGEEGHLFYIIAGGTVRVVKQGRLLSLLHKGDCFGEMAHLSGTEARRTTDVVTKTEVSLIEVDPEKLSRASANCRYQFGDAFLAILVRRLSMANTRIARLLSDHGEEQ